MHEFAICRSLINQVEAVAREHGAQLVTGISLRIGPLAGVDISLLRHAFPIASAGSIAKGARLDIESAAVRIRCKTCGNECAASCNSLLCAECGNWRVELIQGMELLLVNVELEVSD